MSFKANGEFFFLLVLVTACQLFITSCSPRIYPEASVKNIESRAEKKQLKVFMDEGTEKKLDTHSATPDDIIKTAQEIHWRAALHGRNDNEMHGLFRITGNGFCHPWH